MKLKKLIRAEIERLYNNSLSSSHIKHFTLIDQALDLSAEFPDLFSCERCGYDGSRSTYNFEIKRLGYIPDFLKGCN